ncbi:N-terminal phage integrase SAM-like domain-containing protein [Serinicoccus marinus]|uniref:N-terminal phage integrase SAM-like domain-containing protein n=1 Tax=Serinicoccus marinus TaxID=247333 RepID=UPI00192C87C4
MARERRFGSVRRLPSGKWQARYTWEALEHKAPRTFASRDAAEAWLRIKRTELDTGWILTRERRRRSVNFNEYARGWLEERQDLKPRTRVLYAGRLDRHLLPAFGQLTVNAITPTRCGSGGAGWTRTRPRPVPTPTLCCARSWRQPARTTRP